LFAALNRGSQSTKLPIWKRFQANRKKVESMLAEDELLDLFDKASIRVLPKSISKRMSKERAMELIQILYEGI
jgi:hypothetical protein